MLSGVLNEIVGLLPVVVPTMIGFIALRKGISFVLGMLRAALRRRDYEQGNLFPLLYFYL